MAAMALSLSGCIFVSSPRDRAIRHSPSFQAGYDDGCAAATQAGANYRDTPEPDPEYKNDKVYHAGWNNGFNTCRRTNMSPDAGPANPMPEPDH